ncbi:nagb/rpia/CoA transferase-like protein, partial [Dothidotthia symphoricarpi CBS 119687]
YDSALKAAVEDLKYARGPTARQIADAALAHLAHIGDQAARYADTWGELWAMLLYASKHLRLARRDAYAAVTPCLLRALSTTASLFNEKQEQGCAGTAELARIAASTFDNVLMERKIVDEHIGRSFVQWLTTCCAKLERASKEVEEGIGSGAVRVLTLGNSSAIRTAILHALTTIPTLVLNVTILEARSKTEGAQMAHQILMSWSDRTRLSVHVVSCSAMRAAARDIDVMLLGAEQISSKGAVRNKTGTLAAVQCARMLNAGVAVVVLSDMDKIAAPGAEIGASMRRNPHADPATMNILEGKTGIEWISAGLVDAYVTEKGIVNVGEIKVLARELGELEEYIFGRK